MRKLTQTRIDRRQDERGVALVTVLLVMALMLVMVMGITMTSISELGVSGTYGNEGRAFEAADAGLNHATSLISNYKGADFNHLLLLRGASYSDTFTNNIFNPRTASNYFYNAFDPSNAAQFTTGAELIPAASPGLQLKDATGTAIPGAYYRVALINDMPANFSSPSPNPSVPNYNPAVGCATCEPTTGTCIGSPTNDCNKKLILYSTGTYANASVTLEGWVGFLPYPALLSNGNIAAGGNSAINGAYGSVHANGNLTMSSSAYVQQSATASGTFSISGSASVGGFKGGGQPAMTIPHFVTTDPVTSGGPNTSPRLQDYLIQTADVLLIDPGFAEGASTANPPPTSPSDAPTQRLEWLAARLNIPYNTLQGAIGTNHQEAAVTVTRNGTPASGSNNQAVGSAASVTVSSTGWEYKSSNWDIPAGTKSTDAPNGHTFYVIGVDNYSTSNPAGSHPNGGNVKFTGNMGSNASPLQITVFATGSFDLSGTPNITSNLRSFSTPELPPFDHIDMLFAAVEDIGINGDVDGGLVFNGVIYLGEQFNLSGNGKFDGQVVAMNNMDVPSSPVSANEIWGHFDLTLNNGNMLGTVKLISWRQIKE